VVCTNSEIIMKKFLLSLLIMMFVPCLSAFGQTPNFGSGFASTTGLTLNGFGSAAATNGSRLRLTDGGAYEARSVFFSTPVNVQSFTNDFTFLLTKASADGFTFTIQGIGPAALGAPGGALGYGANSAGTILGIGSSVAVGFQLYSKVLGNIEVSLTGDWTNGAPPSATPGSDTTASGVNLHSGDVMSVHMTYDGTTLTWTITDSTVGKSFTKSVTINIPSFAGNTAYVGFTGGTGALTAIQDICTWTYTPGSGAMQQVATPTFSPVAGTYPSAQSVTISDATTGATIYYTTDGSPPTTSSTQFTVPISVSTTTTINAIAAASGMTNSPVATAAYTIQPTVATPTFSPVAGTYPSAQSVTISDTTSGAAIYYTTDGSTPTTSSTQYTVPISVSTTTTIKAIAAASGMTNSIVASASYVIQSSGGGGSPNFASGFPSTGSGLILNGFGSTSAFSGTHLRLTNYGVANEARSAFYSTLVNVQWFITDFNFQLTNPYADGFTFTIQGIGPTALGAPGGALGYGPTTGISGIGKSVAVKFDLYNNAGEGTNSTGLYTNGASPTVPATTISGGVSLHSGHVLSAHLAYDGTTLTLIITDTSTKASFSTTFTVNIPGTVGGNSAYVGFTGGTGGETATQDILTWTYNSVQPTAFMWPVSTPITYAPSNCGPPNDYSFYCSQTPIFGQYHTGIDVCPQSPGCAIGNPVPVSAASSGVVELALVVSDPTQTLCNGSPTTGYQINPSSSNLGNVIVIAHPNGKFTLYGHLDCIWPGVVPGLQVAAGTRIGNMGHSGDGQRDRTFLPHTHFEMKDRAVTGDPTNEGYSGYTSDLPDGYGYHDARIYINPFSTSPLTPTAVKVVAASAQTVFTGPDTSFAALATVAPNQEFVASTTSGSWYKIDMPNDNGLISGWVQGGASLVTADPGAILLQVIGASSSGLTIQVGPASGTNLVSWDYTHQNCKPTAKIWNGQRYVSLGSQNGFNEFFLPSNYYFSSANSCAEPSGSGPSIGWASSTFLH
jgi:murein DD-endopeptidase MepM/ murein hydrolase activator NlpD